VANHNSLELRRVFENILKRKGLRRTQERFYLLDEIYSMTGHFTADELYRIVKEKGFMISRATVYNSLNLFEELGLVIGHHFSKGGKKYEPSLRKQHIHLVCSICNKVSEICIPQIYQLRSLVEEVLPFKVDHHEVVLTATPEIENGRCKYCSKEIKEAEKRRSVSSDEKTDQVLTPL